MMIRHFIYDCEILTAQNEMDGYASTVIMHPFTHEMITQHWTFFQPMFFSFNLNFDAILCSVAK